MLGGESIGNINRISVIVNDEAKEAIVWFQERNGIKTRDEAVQRMAIEYRRILTD